MKKILSRFPFVMAITAFTLAILACRLPSLASLLPSKPAGLALFPRAADGTISGSYQYPREEGREKVFFSATVDGQASFWLEEAPDSGVLEVDLRNTESASLRWGEVVLDGLGALTSEELNALNEVLSGDLNFGLLMVPLDVACQGDVDPVQVAALLYPLQLRFKYQEANRPEMAKLLASLSACNYGGEENLSLGSASLIQMMPSSPVPVVLGYFPFDPEGAVEGGITSSGVLASLDEPIWKSVIKEFVPPFDISGFGTDPIRDEWGPCEAKCRGACGPDCTTRNCILSVDNRCEKNQEGENDGFWSMVFVYNCGLHPACIEHDACYDDCNQRYGCGSFAAAFCMHSEAIATMPFEYFLGTYLSCDSKVLVNDGIFAAKDWMQGYGTFTGRQVFEYTDPQYRNAYDPVSCPLTDEEAPEEPITQPEEQQPPESSEPIIPPAEEAPPEEDLVPSTIPVGVYLGEIEFNEDMMAYAESTTSDVTIIVEPDGTVTGTFTAEVIDTPYTYDFSYQWTWFFTGTFSGNLTSSSGVIQSSEVFYNSVVTDDPLMTTDQFSYVRDVTITIDGDKLIGVTAACPERPNEPMFILTFVTEKFE
jgi:hypothetical protein